MKVVAQLQSSASAKIAVYRAGIDPQGAVGRKCKIKVGVLQKPGWQFIKGSTGTRHTLLVLKETCETERWGGGEEMGGEGRGRGGGGGNSLPSACLKHTIINRSVVMIFV